MQKNIKLLNFRLDSGLTHKEMAFKIGVSKSYYEKIESGERNPSFNFIEKFKSKFNNVNTDSLFFTHHEHDTCRKREELSGQTA